MPVPEPYYECQKCNLRIYDEEYPDGDMPMRHQEDDGVFLPKWAIPNFYASCVISTSII